MIDIRDHGGSYSGESSSNAAKILTSPIVIGSNYESYIYREGSSIQGYSYENSFKAFKRIYSIANTGTLYSANKKNMVISSNIYDISNGQIVRATGGEPAFASYYFIHRAVFSDDNKHLYVLKIRTNSGSDRFYSLAKINTETLQYVWELEPFGKTLNTYNQVDIKLVVINGVETIITSIPPNGTSGNFAFVFFSTDGERLMNFATKKAVSQSPGTFQATSEAVVVGGTVFDYQGNPKANLSVADNNFVDVFSTNRKDEFYYFSTPIITGEVFQSRLEIRDKDMITIKKIINLPAGVNKTVLQDGNLLISNSNNFVVDIDKFE